MAEAVTFLIYLSDGRVLLQFRSALTPKGNKVLEPLLTSINGGSIKPDETVENALFREFSDECTPIFATVEELLAEAEFISTVENKEEDKTVHVTHNHVYVLHNYDLHLKAYAAKANSLEESLDRMANAFLQTEGLGRIAYHRGDLQAAINSGALTGISAQIFEEHPELLPAA